MRLRRRDVRDGVRAHLRRAQLHRHFVQGREFEIERECLVEEAREEAIGDLQEARAERWRPAECEPAGPRRVLLLQDEVGQAPEVIAVQVRDRDRVDRLGVAGGGDRGQGAAAAVEQDASFRRRDEDAGGRAR